MITQKVDFQNSVKSAKSPKFSVNVSEQNFISFGDVMNQNADTSNKQGNAIKSKENDFKKTSSTAKKDSFFTKGNSCNLKTKDNPDNSDSLVENTGSIEELPREKLEEAMMQIQNMFTNVVTETLNITEDELNAALKELNLNVMDLLDPANAARLLMQLNNVSEPMQLLTDENLTAQLDTLSNALEDVLKEIENAGQTGFTKEEAAKYFEQMMPKEQMSTVSNTEIEEENVSLKKTADSENDKTLDDISISVEKGNIGKTAPKEEKFSDLLGDGRNARHESRQDNAAPMETFVQNLAVKGQPAELSVEAAAQKVEIMRSIVEQVVEQIKVAIKPGDTTMELQLNPQNLGKINLVVASRDGQLTANITTQNETAKEALQGQLQILRESLDKQGLKVDAVEVTVSEFAFQSNQGDQTAGNGKNPKNHNRRKIDLNSFDVNAENTTEEDILAAKILKDNGGSIDYTA